jgi:catechol 2,3-dioxygenase-like lactoylglutathione lyase family enzyme
MMNIQLAVVSLYAEDLSQGVHFYRDAIGLKLVPHHAECSHFDLNGTYLTIQKGQPPSAAVRFPAAAFSVGNFEAAIQRLRAQGVELPWGIEEDGGKRWVMFYDPAGNLIELVEGGL